MKLMIEELDLIADSKLSERAVPVPPTPEEIPEPDPVPKSDERPRVARGSGRARSLWSEAHIKWMIKHKDLKPALAYHEFQKDFTGNPATKKQFGKAFWKYRTRDPAEIEPDDILPDRVSQFHPGDIVRLKHPVRDVHKGSGRVIKVKNDDKTILLKFGKFRIWVPEEDVEAVS